MKKLIITHNAIYGYNLTMELIEKKDGYYHANIFPDYVNGDYPFAACSASQGNLILDKLKELNEIYKNYKDGIKINNEIDLSLTNVVISENGQEVSNFYFNKRIIDSIKEFKDTLPSLLKKLCRITELNSMHTIFG